ncbi:RNA recognition motif rrm domain containing protein [Anaeramoeba ignava]|uniref:RNA recognition motif rrm domain containing protein n=1 Tax=Anaeramoeba ignava TaxID=1746090 RepID=A0A9Q0LNT8_ANAIG|nr:RNA recognition motif rrm domain containing protein [Anaeramoeba ignava]
MSYRSRSRSNERSPKPYRGRNRRWEKEPSRCLYVGNLPFFVDEKDLEHLFLKCGELQRVMIGKDFRTGRSRGWGFVTFVDKRDAEDAYHRFQGYSFEGRRLKLDYDEGLERKSRFPPRGRGSFRSRSPPRRRSRSPPRRRRSRSPPRRSRSPPRRSRSPPRRRRSRTPSRERKPRTPSRSLSRERKSRTPSMERKPRTPSRSPSRSPVRDGSLNHNSRSPPRKSGSNTPSPQRAAPNSRSASPLNRSQSPAPRNLRTPNKKPVIDLFKNTQPKEITFPKYISKIQSFPKQVKRIKYTRSKKNFRRNFFSLLGIKPKTQTHNKSLIFNISKIQIKESTDLSQTSKENLPNYDILKDVQQKILETKKQLFDLQKDFLAFFQFFGNQMSNLKENSQIFVDKYHNQLETKDQKIEDLENEIIDCENFIQKIQKIGKNLMKKNTEQENELQKIYKFFGKNWESAIIEYNLLRDLKQEEEQEKTEFTISLKDIQTFEVQNQFIPRLFRK